MEDKANAEAHPSGKGFLREYRNSLERYNIQHNSKIILNKGHSG